MIDPLSRKLLQGAGKQDCLILMYHSVISGNQSPAWRWAVSENQFIQQLDLLQTYDWQTLCLNELGLDKPVPPRSVVISFDDGYADNLVAANAMLERNMKATWFIVSRDIGKKSAWPDSDAQRGMMSASDLCSLGTAGMEIGSHTHSHCRMPELDDDQLRHEVRDSKAILEDTLGMEITSFAYPYGAHDARSVEAVANAGYQAACTTQSGWALIDQDMLKLRRISIFADDNLSSFARKLAFADNHVSYSAVAGYYARQALNRLRPGKTG